MSQRIAIIGAGFSGTLLAINLLRHAGPDVTLIERGRDPGGGLAFGAAHPCHVLNVRAANMSALPDQPDGFVTWLENHGVTESASRFAPRLLYGEYLRATLSEAKRAAGSRLTIVQDDVLDATRRGGGVRLGLAGGASIDAALAILAVGNLPPHPPPNLDLESLRGGQYRANPWEADLDEGLEPGDTILLLGSGLTMIDVALSLEGRGFDGRIIALSRRGLSPRRHALPGPQSTPLGERPRETGAALVSRVRYRSREIGWRAAVDELRPFTQAMWANADDFARAQFLRHLRPWWDVHRHRLAPEVASRVDAMCSDGRLTVVAGRALAAEADGNAVRLCWRPRGSETPETMRVRRIVNCTGPAGDLTRTTEPLLRQLTASGTIRPDAAHLGIDVDPQGRTLAADGEPNDWLLAAGPITRGAFWEIVAVPDIRIQAWAIARRLANAHWVGGEGL